MSMHINFKIGRDALREQHSAAAAAGHAPANDTAQPLGGGKSQRYHQHRAPAQARGNNSRWGTAEH